MKRFFMALLLMAVVAACGPSAKSPAAHDAAAPDFDYRSANNNFKLGVNYLNSGEVHQAIKHLQDAVKLDPGNYRYHHNLGLAYSMNGELEKAVLQLHEALKINEQASESHNLLASIYIDQERYPLAMDHLRKVIQDTSYPHPQFPYFNLGLSYYRQGQNEQALAAFKRVVQLTPNFHRAHIQMAKIYKERDEREMALNHYLKALPGYTDNVDVLFQIGHLLYQLRRYDDAKTYLAQVSILFPPPQIDSMTQSMLRNIEAHQSGRN